MPSPNHFYLVTLLHSRGLANPLVIDPFDTMPKDPSATSCCTCTIYMLYAHSTLHLPQCTHDQAVSSYYVLPSSTISSDPWCWQSETTVLDFWAVASFGTLVRTLFVRFSINAGARVAKAAKRSSTLCGSVRSPASLPDALRDSSPRALHLAWHLTPASLYLVIMPYLRLHFALLNAVNDQTRTIPLRAQARLRASHKRRHAPLPLLMSLASFESP